MLSLFGNKNTLNDGTTVTFHKPQKQSSLNERHSLTELREICTVAGEMGRLIGQLCGFIPIRRNQSQKVERTAPKLEIWETEVRDLRG